MDRAGRVARFVVLAFTSLAVACGGSSGTNPPPSSGGTRSLSGTVTYDFVPSVYDPQAQTGTLDFAAAAQRPVRAGTVQVMKGSALVATTTTDAAGHYALSFTEPAGADPLVVAALAESTAPAIRVVDNTDAGAIWAVGAAVGASVTTVNLHATHGYTGTGSQSGYDPATRRAAPFAILDSMYTAGRAFMAVRPATFPTLIVNWSPNNTNVAGDVTIGQISTSHFSPGNNQIYILGKAGVDTDEFDAHVIVHEWGHYFEKNLSRSDSIGGSHSFGQLLDPRVAFGEGYGTAIAAMLLPESVYSDTLWNGANIVGFGYDAETDWNGDDPNPGPFSEASVMRLLYDIFDSGTNEGFDTVGVGLGVIYDVLTGPERTTDALTSIASFIAGLKAQPGVSATAVDALLAHYDIGPITDAWGTGDEGLTGMYVAADLPSTQSIVLGGPDGDYLYNRWEQNEYYVFFGTGGTVTVSATSDQDVALTVYQRGVQVGGADANLSGTETVTIPTTAGKIYVVNLIGFGKTPGGYQVDLQFSSP